MMWLKMIYDSTQHCVELSWFKSMKLLSKNLLTIDKVENKYQGSSKVEKKYLMLVRPSLLS